MIVNKHRIKLEQNKKTGEFHSLQIFRYMLIIILLTAEQTQKRFCVTKKRKMFKYMYITDIKLRRSGCKPNVMCAKVTLARHER